MIKIGFPKGVDSGSVAGLYNIEALIIRKRFLYYSYKKEPPK